MQFAEGGLAKVRVRRIEPVLLVPRFHGDRIGDTQKYQNQCDFIEVAPKTSH